MKDGQKQNIKNKRGKGERKHDPFINQRRKKRKEKGRSFARKGWKEQNKGEMKGLMVPDDVQHGS